MSIPWAYYHIADKIPKSDPEWGPTNGWKNHWGYEMDMIKDAAKYLNFTYKIGSTPDQYWGLISANGTWDGLVAEIYKNNIDLALCFVTFLKNQGSSCKMPLCLHSDALR